MWSLCNKGPFEPYRPSVRTTTRQQPEGGADGNRMSMRELLIIAAFLVAGLGLAGCAEPGAVVGLINTANQALASVEEADAVLQNALLAQLEEDLAELNKAFLSDMRGLAGGEGRVTLEDVEAGMRLYNSKRSAIEDSRRNLKEAFSRKSRSLGAARQLLRYAEDLVIRNRAAWHDAQQYVQFFLETQGDTRWRKTSGTQP